MSATKAKRKKNETNLEAILKWLNTPTKVNEQHLKVTQLSACDAEIFRCILRAPTEERAWLRPEDVPLLP